MKRSAEVVFDVFDFESNAVKSQPVQRVRLQQSMGTLPLYERADLFPASASAYNKAMDYTPALKPMTEDIYRVDEAALRYNIAAANYNGGRIIVQDDLPFRVSMRESKTHHKIVEDHYINISAEPEHGLHTVNPSTRSAFASQKSRPTGASNTMRAYGEERYFNPRINPRLPVGIPFSVDPQRAVDDGVRINTTVVNPIATFPSIGF